MRSWDIMVRCLMHEIYWNLLSTTLCINIFECRFVSFGYSPVMTKTWHWKITRLYISTRNLYASISFGEPPAETWPASNMTVWNAPKRSDVARRCGATQVPWFSRSPSTANNNCQQRTRGCWFHAQITTFYLRSHGYEIDRQEIRDLERMEMQRTRM